MQQFDMGAFDEAQLQQAALQFDRVGLVMAMGADLDDHSAIAATGLTQLDGVGQIYARTEGRRTPAALYSVTVIISRARPAPAGQLAQLPRWTIAVSGAKQEPP
ncbi:hypothetical protein GCM10009081_33860 [Brevundimonas nasdae]